MESAPVRFHQGVNRSMTINSFYRAEAGPLRTTLSVRFQWIDSATAAISVIIFMRR